MFADDPFEARQSTRLELMVVTVGELGSWDMSRCFCSCFTTILPLVPYFSSSVPRLVLLVLVKCFGISMASVQTLPGRLGALQMPLARRVAYRPLSSRINRESLSSDPRPMPITSLDKRFPRGKPQLLR